VSSRLATLIAIGLGFWKENEDDSNFNDISVISTLFGLVQPWVVQSPQ
jgi:hypothetical protein